MTFIYRENCSFLRKQSLLCASSVFSLTAKTRSDRDFEMSLCYTPKAFSCLEETKYNINHCLELAPGFPKMYNITMF